MGILVPVVLPVTAPLDTAWPATNRPQGTLVSAIDVGHRWWGPRRGAKAFTWIGRLSPDTYQPGPAGASWYSFDGTNTYIKGETTKEQGDLGTQWTLDLVFHPTENRAVNAAVAVLRWKIDNAIDAIDVGFYGSTHAKAGKVYATVVATSSPGVPQGPATLESTTALTFNSSAIASGKSVRVFLRLVRDGGTLTLYILGPFQQTVTATYPELAKPYGSVGTFGQHGAWFLGTDAGLGGNATFKGHVLRAVLRSGIYASRPRIVEHTYPRGPDVLYAFTPWRVITATGKQDYVTDQSSFGTHGFVNAPGSAAPSEVGFPWAKKVQAVGSFTDRSGVATSVVMVGGVLYFQRMR